MADCAGLLAILLQNVLLDGFDGVPTTGRNSGRSEVSLDIELAMAMAPGLESIIVYEAGPSGIANDVLNRMANDNVAKQLSCSWDFGSPTTGSADQIFQQMAAQGQSFFDASGDNGGYTGSIPPPDDDPYITLVGGTTLTRDGKGPNDAEVIFGGLATLTAYDSRRREARSDPGTSSASRVNPRQSLGLLPVYHRAWE